MNVSKNKNLFREKVYTLVRKIPAGKVITYGQLAKEAGSSQAARAVGMFMSQNPDKKTIPCHRVVSSTGALTGYAFGKGIETKKKLLIREGVVFKNKKVDLEKSGWAK